MSARTFTASRGPRVAAATAGLTLALCGLADSVTASPVSQTVGTARVALAPAATTGAATRGCAAVTFAGVADFRLKHIRATGVRCSTARKVVRGARNHTRWHSHGFACKVTGYVPEVATLYRCAKGQHRRIRFQAG